MGLSRFALPEEDIRMVQCGKTVYKIKVSTDSLSNKDLSPHVHGLLTHQTEKTLAALLHEEVNCPISLKTSHFMMKCSKKLWKVAKEFTFVRNGQLLKPYPEMFLIKVEKRQEVRFSNGESSESEEEGNKEREDIMDVNLTDKNVAIYKKTQDSDILDLTSGLKEKLKNTNGQDSSAIDSDFELSPKRAKRSYRRAAEERLRKRSGSETDEEDKKEGSNSKRRGRPKLRQQNLEEEGKKKRTRGRPSKEHEKEKNEENVLTGRKGKRGRPRKTPKKETEKVIESDSPRKRGRPRNIKRDLEDAESDERSSEEIEYSDEEDDYEVLVRKRKGGHKPERKSPRKSLKNRKTNYNCDDSSTEESENEQDVLKDKKGKRGRPRKEETPKKETEKVIENDSPRKRGRPRNLNRDLEDAESDERSSEESEGSDEEDDYEVLERKRKGGHKPERKSSRKSLKNRKTNYNCDDSSTEESENEQDVLKDKKGKRGRPRKEETPKKETEKVIENDSPRKRGRPRNLNRDLEDAESDERSSEESEGSDEEDDYEVLERKRKGGNKPERKSPRKSLKNRKTNYNCDDSSTEENENEQDVLKDKKGKRGRPRKEETPKKETEKVIENDSPRKRGRPRNLNQDLEDAESKEQEEIEYSDEDNGEELSQNLHNQKLLERKRKGERTPEKKYPRKSPRKSLNNRKANNKSDDSSVEESESENKEDVLTDKKRKRGRPRKEETPKKERQKVVESDSPRKRGRPRNLNLDLEDAVSEDSTEIGVAVHKEKRSINSPQKYKFKDLGDESEEEEESSDESEYSEEEENDEELRQKIHSQKLNKRRKRESTPERKSPRKSPKDRKANYKCDEMSSDEREFLRDQEKKKNPPKRKRIRKEDESDSATSDESLEEDDSNWDDIEERVEIERQKELRMIRSPRTRKRYEISKHLRKTQKTNYEEKESDDSEAESELSDKNDNGEKGSEKSAPPKRKSGRPKAKKDKEKSDGLRICLGPKISLGDLKNQRNGTTSRKKKETVTPNRSKENVEENKQETNVQSRQSLRRMQGGNVGRSTSREALCYRRDRSLIQQEELAEEMKLQQMARPIK